MLTHIVFFYVSLLDNIACPLASSFGDLVTLLILSGIAVFLQEYISKPYKVIITAYDIYCLQEPWNSPFNNLAYQSFYVNRNSSVRRPTSNFAHVDSCVVLLCS